MRICRVIIAVILLVLFAGCQRTYTVLIRGDHNAITVKADVPKEILIKPDVDLKVPLPDIPTL